MWKLLSSRLTHHTDIRRSFYGFPAFQRQFGEPTGDPENPYELTAAWQAGLSNGVMGKSTISRPQGQESLLTLPFSR